MSNLHRYISALVLCVIYVVVVLSPLAAQLAMRSPVVAHAMTGECAGECGLCGCAPERSASHTCCCWQKKLQQKHDDDLDEPDCCKKIHAEQDTTTVSIGSLPCNSAKNIAFVGAERGDLLPFQFIQGVLTSDETPLTASHPVCRADRPGEPPDPPPKLS